MLTDFLSAVTSSVVLVDGAMWLRPTVLGVWMTAWLVGWSLVGFVRHARLLGKRGSRLSADVVLLALSLSVGLLAEPRAPRSLTERAYLIPLVLAAVLVGVRCCRIWQDRLVWRTAHLRGTEQAFDRIARELHDGTLQTLAVAKMRLRAACRSDSHGALAEASSSVSRLIDEQISSLRGLTHGLRPARLHKEGLVAAVRQLADEASEAWGITVEAEVQERRPYAGPLDPAYEITAYRVLQEALSNALRHSGATLIRIRVMTQRFLLLGEVVDNGRGFAATAPPGKTGRGTGLGLDTMRERVEEAGGRLSIRSAGRRGAPGRRGTSVRFFMPISSVSVEGETDCGPDAAGAVFPQSYEISVDRPPGHGNSGDGW